MANLIVANMSQFTPQKNPHILFEFLYKLKKNLIPITYGAVSNY